MFAVLAGSSSRRREHGQIGKTQKLPSMACSARTILGAGRFPLLTVFPARLANVLLPDPIFQQSAAIPI